MATKPTELTSMKLPPRKPTAEEKRYPTMATEHEPEYPYGLALTLDEKQLDALGIKDMPTVGGEVHLHAKGHITSAEQRESQDGSHRSVGVQLTHLHLE